MKQFFAALVLIATIGANAQAPIGCNTQQIINTFTGAGYIQLNVIGQPCSMYFVNPTAQSADLSQQQAASLGGNMVVFNDAAENQNVVNALNAQNIFAISNQIWIGYKRTGTGQNSFYALDGTTGNFIPGPATPSVYQNWAAGEPNNSGYQCAPGCLVGCNIYACQNGEQCVEIYNQGTWNDEKCNDGQSISIIEVNMCPQTTETRDTAVCENQTVRMNSTTILGSQPYSYSWSTGATTNQIFVTPASTTPYYLTVTDRYNCKSIDTVNVTVNNCPNPTGPQGCDVPQILNTFSGAGYIPLNVQGQPCSMYFINPNTQDAASAQASAAALGANMVVFNDAAENTNVSNALNSAGYGGQTIWLGYRRTSTGSATFYALDGSTGNFTPGPATSSVYQNWASGEPNNNGYNGCTFGCGSPFCSDQYRCTNGEQCVQIYAGGQWNDLPCNRTSISVIEVNLCPDVNATVNNQTLNNLKRDTTVCAGASVNLKTNPIQGSKPYSYLWTPGNQATQNNLVQPTVATQYLVKVTDRFGCFSTDTLIVNIQGTFNAGFTANPQQICSGQTSTLTFNGTPSSNATFTWGLNGGTIVSGTANGPGPLVVRWNTSGTKNVTLNINDGGCVIPQATGTVTVSANPVANAGPDKSICSGGATPLGGAPVPGASYYWSPSSGLSDSLAANPIAADTNLSTQPKLKTYYLVMSNNGCTGIDTVVLTVDPPQTAAISPSGTVNLCLGGDTVITSTQTFAQYLWSNNATTQSITVNQSGAYSFGARDAQGCLWRSSVTTVNVATTPLATTATALGTVPVCKGGSIILSSDSVYNAYAWSNNANTKDITVTQAGTYFVTAINANKCHVRSNDLVITFDLNPKPITITADGPTSFCQGGSVNLSTDSVFQTYAWSNAASVQSINVSQSATYNVTTTDIVGCEGLSNNIVVTAWTIPTVTASVIGDQRCYNKPDGNITVAGSAGASPYNFAWGGGQTGSAINNLLPGVYDVTVTDANQCTGNGTFNVQPAPFYSLNVSSIKDVSCFNGRDGSITVSGAGGSPGYTYLWSTGAQTATVNNIAAGNYSVTVLDSKSCIETVTATVVQPDEIVAIAPTLSEIRIGNKQQLEILVTPLSNNYTYQWTPQKGLSCYDCFDPIASPVKSINYTFVVKDAKGCADTLIIPFVVNPDKVLYIPNYFSPNGDGANEMWCVFSDAVQSIDLKVFNRWGEKVYESYDIKQCWDGFMRGELVEPGAYAYLLKVSYIDETFTQRQGSLFVYR